MCVAAGRWICSWARSDCRFAVRQFAASLAVTTDERPSTTRRRSGDIPSRVTGVGWQNMRVAERANGRTGEPGIRHSPSPVARNETNYLVAECPGAGSITPAPRCLAPVLPFGSAREVSALGRNRISVAAGCWTIACLPLRSAGCGACWTSRRRRLTLDAGKGEEWR
jgi:hypothetical protein